MVDEVALTGSTEVGRRIMHLASTTNKSDARARQQSANIILDDADLDIAAPGAVWAIFGPVLSVIRYDSVDDAIRMANESIYGLAGGVWSRDVPRAINVAKRLKTGSVWINDYHLVNGYAPFGGYKQSGIGRELGAWGIREYQQTKYIQVDQVPSKDQKFWFQILGL